MMSDENKEISHTWLAKEYPAEWYFTDKFKHRLFDVLRKMPDDTFLKFLEASNLLDPPMKGKDLDGKLTPDIQVSPYFLMLFGILASTISDAVSEALKESQISSSTKFGEILDRIVKQKIALNHPMAETSENKKCNSCGIENRGAARYCDNCGLSFQG